MHRAFIVSGYNLRLIRHITKQYIILTWNDVNQRKHTKDKHRYMPLRLIRQINFTSISASAVLKTYTRIINLPWLTLIKVDLFFNNVDLIFHESNVNFKEERSTTLCFHFINVFTWVDFLLKLEKRISLSWVSLESLSTYKQSWY